MERGMEDKGSDGGDDGEEKSDHQIDLRWDNGDGEIVGDLKTTWWKFGTHPADRYSFPGYRPVLGGNLGEWTVEVSVSGRSPSLARRDCPGL